MDFYQAKQYGQKPWRISTNNLSELYEFLKLGFLNSEHVEFKVNDLSCVLKVDYFPYNLFNKCGIIEITNNSSIATFNFDHIYNLRVFILELCNSPSNFVNICIKHNVNSEESPEEPLARIKIKRVNRFIETRVKKYVWNRDNGQCVECGSKERLEYDHIIPISKGGSNTERNIQLLCELCNRKKSDQII